MAWQTHTRQVGHCVVKQADPSSFCDPTVMGIEYTCTSIMIRSQTPLAWSSAGQGTVTNAPRRAAEG